MIKPGLTVMAAVCLAACGSDSDSDDNKSVVINFGAGLGTEVMACGPRTTPVGSQQTQPEVKDFRLYISDVQVAGSDGQFRSVELEQNDWQHKNVALLDFEDGSASCSGGNAAMNKQLTGNVKDFSGDVAQVRFTIGVPESLNHLDRTTAASPLNIDGMTWSWAGGYKHARLDVNGWNIHLGTTGCTLDDNNQNLDCSNDRPNRPTYTLSGIDLDDDKIYFDYAALVNSADISSNMADTPLGCMSFASDSDCAPVFTAMGLDLTSGECAAAGCDSQTWVSITPLDQ
ncbi:metallo-mystery pair system four-Cys motif protein [Bacterioplanes sanyensis]|uniref:Metallo-mystery pair system four-Cys motif protein n=1 Tax=Bacterioplanes sanyensis TaxID=1249553 RepID=A0A222FFV5_9GAMM|nr:MbnP family copper-binding protein [Bacterioplanes sanyensis]ASP37650.1 metallo-mystery pair system four-Cys motif protein [Bacterioplanes sanyensis]